MTGRALAKAWARAHGDLGSSAQHCTVKATPSSSQWGACQVKCTWLDHCTHGGIGMRSAHSHPHVVMPCPLWKATTTSSQRAIYDLGVCLCLGTWGAGRTHLQPAGRL